MISSPVCYRFRGFELHIADRRLLANGVEVPIGARAFDLLAALVGREGRLATKNELLSEVWQGLVVEENNLQVQISALRKLFGSDVIQTAARHGYRFALPLTASDSAADVGGARGESPAPPQSIAVLPFAILGDDPAAEYFADGLADGLLTLLSHVPGLRVTSRTSSFQFRGARVDVPAIARKLNVRTVLEGSIQKSGRRMKIAVQLIDAATDTHLWACNFDRNLDDAFAVQDEIAASVADELRHRLLGEGAPGDEARYQSAGHSKGRTTSLVALDLFLRGRQLCESNQDADTEEGIRCLREAVAVDPYFALAWVQLALVECALAGYGLTPNTFEGFTKARIAASRAIDIDPNLGSAHAILAWIRLYGDWDRKGAEASARRALQLFPNDRLVLVHAQLVLGHVGCREEARRLAQRLVQVDPLAGSAHRQLALVQLDDGDVAAAEASFARALALWPRLGLTHFRFGELRLAQNRIEEAIAAFEDEWMPDYRWLGLVHAHHVNGARQASDDALQAMMAACATTSPTQIAAAHAVRGEPDAAFDWLERALQHHDPRMVEIGVEPMLRPLHGDPRWKGLLERMGM
jgi:TolB-like protein